MWFWPHFVALVMSDLEVQQSHLRAVSTKSTFTGFGLGSQSFQLLLHCRLHPRGRNENRRSRLRQIPQRQVDTFLSVSAGSAISNGREPRSCLGRVFNIKLGSFVSKQLNCMARTHTATSWKLGLGFVLLAEVCPWYLRYSREAKDFGHRRDKKRWNCVKTKSLGQEKPH